MTDEDRQAEDVANALMGKERCRNCDGQGTIVTWEDFDRKEERCVVCDGKRFRKHTEVLGNIHYVH